MRISRRIQLYVLLGRSEEAKEIYQRALIRLQKVLGSSHERCGWLVNNETRLRVAVEQTRSTVEIRIMVGERKVPNCIHVLPHLSPWLFGLLKQLTMM
jgi:hypothetical protein